MFRRSRNTTTSSPLSGLGLTDQESAALDAVGTIVDVPAGVVLCRQHALGRQLVWIIRGVAAVERDGQAVALIEDGDVFGEGTMVGTQERCSADVVALTPMTVAVLSRQEWLIARDRAPSLVDRLFVVALRRARPV